MKQKTYKITCDRAIAEEIIDELKQDENSYVELSEPSKKIEGVTEVVSIIASLTTIGVNILMAWLSARPHLKDNVDVSEETEDEPEQ